MYIKKSFTLTEALSDSDRVEIHIRESETLTETLPDSNRVGKHFYGWDYSCEDDYDPLTCTSQP